MRITRRQLRQIIQEMAGDRLVTEGVEQHTEAGSHDSYSHITGVIDELELELEHKPEDLIEFIELLKGTLYLIAADTFFNDLFTIERLEKLEKENLEKESISEKIASLEAVVSDMQSEIQKMSQRPLQRLKDRVGSERG